jgi:hypothetical protein
MTIAARNGSTFSLAAFRRRGTLRSFAAFIGILALLAQFWIPLVHHPVGGVPTSGPSTSKASLAGLIVDAICHVDLGISVDRPADGSPAKPGHESGPVCPICLGLHLCGTFVLPLVAAVLAVLGVPLVLRFEPPSAGLASRATRLSAQPRAPPLPV